MQTDVVNIISKETELPSAQVEAAIKLFEEGNSLPFIARYRKEATNALNETQLRSISDRLEYLKKLAERKNEILHSIEEQGKLTDELRKSIENAATLQAAEDIYHPFRKGKKSRADTAREKGLQPVADFITTARNSRDDYFNKFLDPEKKLLSVDDVKNQALDIIAENVAGSVSVKNVLRSVVMKYGFLVSVKAKKKSEEIDPKGIFRDYYEYRQPLGAVPPYRILAMNRGESEGVLKICIELIPPPLQSIQKFVNFTPDLAYFNLLQKAVEDGYERLLFPAIEREIRTKQKETAEDRAIEVFSKNMRHLLLTSPLKGKRVLGIDPGFRSGCKCAAIDENGTFLGNETIYPHQPQNETMKARIVLEELAVKYRTDVIAIGNGTASRETESFVADWLKESGNKNTAYIIVSEAGASVYSASNTAVEEFPDEDVTTRGAISIARRVQDPLAELVKISPEAIGVGMYQHDVNAGKLKASLEREVESVVNFVGVDLNTASSYLLTFISGLNKRTANAVVKHRNENGSFKNRRELLTVKGIGPKAFEQAAGFCRVPESDNPLDNTIIHPESYVICEKILNACGFSLTNLGNTDSRDRLREAFAELKVVSIAQQLDLNPITVTDIVSALTAKHLDPRAAFPQPILKKEVRSLTDLTEGMRLQGTVRNVVDFGAFVDIGVKVDGLIHKSRMGGRSRNPLEELFVGQIVEVRVLQIEHDRGRIQLEIATN